MTRVLVVASTFPAADDDPVPAFVRDQVTAMHAASGDLEFHVLAPHDRRSGTVSRRSHRAYEEYRFHYLWPRRWEVLAGRGIMPALRERPALYAVLPLFVAAELVALARLARRLDPDVVYAHWFTPQGVTASWVARLVGARFVFTTHSSDVSVWRRVPLVGGVVVRAHARRAAAITAVSRRTMGNLASFFSPEEWAQLEPRTSVIPMAVDVDEPPRSTTREQTITFVGRLVEKKGVQILLQALATAREELAGWRVVIAGDGPWRERLEAQAAALGVDAEFPGYVTGEAKRSVVESAGIFVVPSVVAQDGDAEGLPVSLLEGLAAGRICVATFGSGAQDVVTDGVDGVLVRQRDVSALADALVRVATMDDSTATAMARAARERATAFGWPRVARRHIDALFSGA